MEQPPPIPTYSFDMTRVDWILSFLTLGAWYQYKSYRASEKYDADYEEHIVRMNSWLKRRGIDYKMGFLIPAKLIKDSASR